MFVIKKWINLKNNIYVDFFENLPLYNYKTK